MDLRRIRYFLAACEGGTLARAAIHTGKSAKTLAGQLLRLEQDLNVALFEDLSHPILKLTAAGDVYRADCQRIFSELTAATRQAHGIAEGRTGVLRLGVCEDATTRWLTLAIQRFTIAYPDMQFELCELPSVKLATALRRHEIDLALLLPGIDDTDLTLHPLWSDTWQVTAPPGFPRFPDRTIRAEDIADQPVVLMHPSLGPVGHDCIRRAFWDAGIVPNVAALCLGRSTMLALGMIEVGLTFIPTSLVQGIGNPEQYQSFAFEAPDLQLMAAFRSSAPPGIAMRFLRTLCETTADRDHISA